MAERPTAKSVSDWQTINPSDWQEVNGSTASQIAAPDESTSLTKIRPHQSDTPAHALEDVFSNIGAGGIGALETLGRISPWGAAADKAMGGPTIYEEGYHALKHAFQNPGETGHALAAAGKDVLAHPLENIEGGIGAAGAGAIIPVGAEAADALPSARRAGQVFQSIRNEAKDLPVAMENSAPQLQRFEDLTQVGGARSKPFTQLYKRIQPGEEPVNYPEAHDFYSNIGDRTSPTTLQKMMGRGMKPNMLRQGVMTRQALKQDLANSLDPIGRSQDFLDAQREYANAMKLRKVMKVGGLLAAGEAARRTGLLGNWIHRTALQQ